MHKHRIVPLISLALFVVATHESTAGPVVTVGRQVPVNNRIPVDGIDHTEWDRLLRTYVNERGFVNYSGWKASAVDTRALDAYLVSLSRADLAATSTRDAQLAFWINAYNALTINGILREYPTSSIRNHTAKLAGYNIWKDLQLIVSDSAISLDEIEHKVLRKMNEPRIHFAIVCASLSCPRLLNEAYVPANLVSQLERNTRAFFATPGNFRLDLASQRIYLSSILKWFAEDFGSDAGARLRNIAPYLPTAAARQAAASGNLRISYLDYDWSLNDQARLSAGR